MYARMMIRLLIGDNAFIDMLIQLPDEFFKLHNQTQEALWKAVLAKINEGTKDLHELVIFAHSWIELYLVVKLSVNKAISKL